MTKASKEPAASEKETGMQTAVKTTTAVAAAQQ